MNKPTCGLKLLLERLNAKDDLNVIPSLYQKITKEIAHKSFSNYKTNKKINQKLFLEYAYKSKILYHELDNACEILAEYIALKDHDIFFALRALIEIYHKFLDRNAIDYMDKKEIAIEWLKQLLTLPTSRFVEAMNFFLSFDARYYELLKQMDTKVAAKFKRSNVYKSYNSKFLNDKCKFFLNLELHSTKDPAKIVKICEEAFDGGIMEKPFVVEYVAALKSQNMLDKCLNRLQSFENPLCCVYEEIDSIYHLMTENDDSINNNLKINQSNLEKTNSFHDLVFFEK